MSQRTASTEEQHASPGDGILLNDFESPEEAEVLLKTWQVSTDASAAGRSLGELEVISPGAAGTGHALRFKGRVESATGFEQGYVAARYAFTLPAGARACAAFSLKCAGSAVFSKSRSFHPTPTLPAPHSDFIPDSEWQSVRLPAAWLTTPNPLPPKSTLVLEFRVDGPPGNFELDMDEIRFY